MGHRHQCTVQTLVYAISNGAQMLAGVRGTNQQHIDAPWSVVSILASSRWRVLCFMTVFMLDSHLSTDGLQTQCGVNFFILDSRRVLAPAPKVLGSDIKTHLKSRFCVQAILKKRGVMLECLA